MDFEEEVKELIDCHQESDYLDFKEQNYHKDNKVELVKDLITFANSHSIRNKYIIIGIKEENNVCVDVLGLAEYIEIKYGIKVRDIKIDENLNIEENKRPEYIRNIGVKIDFEHSFPSV